MSTTDPDGISPEDLIAYIDDEAMPEMRELVQSMPGVRAAAASYGRLQRRLQATLHRFECPSPLLLGEYNLGVVTPEAHTWIARHVSGCPLCMDELQLLRSFLPVEPLPTVRGPVERVRRLAAVFVPHSFTSSLASVRGVGNPATRTYLAEDIMISFDLSAEVRRGRTTLFGLIWRDGADLEALPDASVALFLGNEVIQTTAIDDSGGFILEGVPAGIYRVEVTLGNEIISVDELHI